MTPARCVSRSRRACAALALLAGWLCGGAQVDDVRATLGQPAPGFALKDHAETIRAWDQSAGPEGLVLVFLTTRLADELAPLAALPAWLESRGIGIVWVDVTYKVDVGAAESFYRAGGLRGPILYDRRRWIAAAYEVTAVPTAFFADAKQRLRYRGGVADPAGLQTALEQWQRDRSITSPTGATASVPVRPLPPQKPRPR